MDATSRRMLTHDWQCDAAGKPTSNPSSPLATEWLRKLLGEDFFADVTNIRFGYGPLPFPPPGLEHLECLTRVK